MSKLVQKAARQWKPKCRWGVELGKVLAQRIVPELESETEPKLGHDGPTNRVIGRYRKLKEPR
jgi:glucose-6-phosphate isomerase